MGRFGWVVLSSMNPPQPCRVSWSMVVAPCGIRRGRRQNQGGIGHFAPKERRAVATGGAARRRSRPTRNPWKRDLSCPRPAPAGAKGATYRILGWDGFPRTNRYAGSILRPLPGRASPTHTASTGFVRLRLTPPVATALGPFRGRQNAHRARPRCHGPASMPPCPLRRGHVSSSP